MGLFSKKAFKTKDGNKKTTGSTTDSTAAKPKWVDSWMRTRVDPEEVAELLHGCTQEIKSRGLDIPFLLLPFRPSSDPSAARTFVRNYFLPPNDRSKLTGDILMNELKMTEVMVLISVVKWCWARLPGGVVTWETYKMFTVGEKDAGYARDAFSTFLPISVESSARMDIIRDFFDLQASLAAHGKTNGLSGHKLSRYAGWWAFEHYDTGEGFDAGYKSWVSAADATSHLLFAYLRSLAPEPGKTNGILDLPRSLQQLVATTEYPPRSAFLSNDTTKVVMVVDVVSPTPFALLRRVRNFEYRDDDRALRQFSEHTDPIDALTDECRRVLRAISLTNQSDVSDAKTSTSLVDPSWSRFEDIGFSATIDESAEGDAGAMFAHPPISDQAADTSSTTPNALNLNRPTTPSWADFLSAGFVDETSNKALSPILLPPDKILPPINALPRGQSSQSHRRDIDAGSTLEPGELASITTIAVDDAFWWVWISSLAGEEPISRKAVFGRCACIETSVVGGRWMVMEEQLKGAAPEPVQGAYIAEKKGFLGFSSRKSRLGRRRSSIKKNRVAPSTSKTDIGASRTSLAPDQEAKIHKAARELSNRKAAEAAASQDRGRRDVNGSAKTNSIYTLGPLMTDEASPALQWAKQYDKHAIRAQYLGNDLTGKGSSDFLLAATNGTGANKSTSTLHSAKIGDGKDSSVAPTPPAKETEVVPSMVKTAGSPVVPPAAPLNIPQAPAKEEHEPARATAPVSVPTTMPVREEVQALPAVPTVATSPVSAATDAAPTAPVPPAAKSPNTADRSKLTKDNPASTQAPRGSNIKRLFGTLRKNKDEPERSSGQAVPQANPAVAAARQALASKVNAPTRPSMSNDKVEGGQSVKNRVAALSHPSETVPAPPPKTAEDAPIATTVPAPLPVQQEPVELEATAVPTVHPESWGSEWPSTPPRTRRDEEFDQLSRVDTREREQADKEFSRFDQGVMPEHGNAAADGSPSKHDLGERDQDDEDSGFRSDPKHQSVYSAMTMQTETTDDDYQPDVAKHINANDRWAQIRKNAAERAARTSEDHGNHSRTETRTDDGETSGEETIESRVARIKARVAELTGNMEQARL